MRFQGTWSHHPLKKTGRRSSAEAETMGPSYCTPASDPMLISSALNSLCLLNPTCHAYPRLQASAQELSSLRLCPVSSSSSLKMQLGPPGNFAWRVSPTAILGIQDPCALLYRVPFLPIYHCVVVLPLVWAPWKQGLSRGYLLCQQLLAQTRHVVCTRWWRIGIKLLLKIKQSFMLLTLRSEWALISWLESKMMNHMWRT